MSLDEDPSRSFHNGLQGQRSSMHNMGGTESMRTVLQKINTHEMRLERIEKQFHELVGVIQQIVGVRRGRQAVQVDVAATNLDGSQKEAACPPSMANDEARNVGPERAVEEGISRPCVAENEDVSGCQEQVGGSADSLEECYRPSPAQIEVEDVVGDEEEPIGSVKKTDKRNVVLSEKDRNEVLEEVDIEKGITESGKPLNVYSRKSTSKPHWGRATIVTRSKAKEVTMLSPFNFPI